MAVKTLKSLVLKTVKVTSVKLPTPADRIGSGAAVVDSPPADFLSQGHSFQPQLPSLNRVRPQEVAAMRYEPTSVVPTSLVGSVSGPSARRRPAAFPAAKHATRAGHPWSLCDMPRLGSDCQSPDRDDARTDLTAAWRPATTARTAGTIAGATAAGK
jgi:hypothetical protein